MTLEVWRDEKLAVRTVWILSSLPWAFVFSMAYTESLFLAFSVGSILVAYRISGNATSRLVLLAGLLAGLATFTRHTGLFIACCVVWLVAITPANLTLPMRLRNMMFAIVPSVIVFSGFVLYIGLQTGRLFTVVSAHGAWGNGYLNDLPRLLILPPANPMWSVDFLEVLGLISWIALSIGAVFMFVYAYRRRDQQTGNILTSWPGAWAFVGYTAVSIMLLLIAHTASVSWGRYMMTVFPCVWPLAWWLTKRSAFRIFISMSLALQVVFFASVTLAQFTP